LYTYIVQIHGNSAINSERVGRLTDADSRP
jgi:hypothetical protein